MENDAIAFYRKLKDNPLCPFCREGFTTLRKLSWHLKKAHNKTFSEWLFETNPNHCKNCDKQIFGKVSDVYRVNFCSKSCATSGKFNSRYAAILSDETKQKIARAHIGKKASLNTRLLLKERCRQNRDKLSALRKEYARTHENYWKGKTFSKEYREKLSKAKRLKRASSWQGNFSRFCTQLRTYLYPTWTKPILERDGYLCQHCHGDRMLAVHHFQSFRSLVREVFQKNPELSLLDYGDKWKLHDKCLQYEPLSDTTNGITLCQKCHRAEHTRAKAQSRASPDFIKQQAFLLAT